MYYGPRPMQETLEVPPVVQYSLVTVKILYIQNSTHVCGLVADGGGSIYEYGKTTPSALTAQRFEPSTITGWNRTALALKSIYYNSDSPQIG
jgi:hypothetical protein